MTEFCLSRELLENELIKHNDRIVKGASLQPVYNERDRRLVSAYRSFVRFNIIKQKRENILDDFLFTTLAKYLCAMPKVTYEDFKAIASMAPSGAKKYFSAKCFLKFPRDENQCIDSEDVVR
jgi:hypothetical protein